jgi:hypothetical protein
LGNVVDEAVWEIVQVLWDEDLLGLQETEEVDQGTFRSGLVSIVYGWELDKCGSIWLLLLIDWLEIFS